MEITHDGITHSFSGTTPASLWFSGETQKALELILDPFHGLSTAEIKETLEIILRGKVEAKNENE